MDDDWVMMANSIRDIRRYVAVTSVFHPVLKWLKDQLKVFKSLFFNIIMQLEV